MWSMYSLRYRTIQLPILQCLMPMYTCTHIRMDIYVPSQGERDPLFWSLNRYTSNSYKLRSLLPREDEWEIPSDCLVRESQLGEGCFGEVHKGFVRGPIETSHTLKSAVYTTVAIKYLKRKCSIVRSLEIHNVIGSFHLTFN